MKSNIISTNLKEDGTLEIYCDNTLLAEIENGTNSEEFIENVLYGMGYKWNSDGTIEKIGEFNYD